MKFKLLIIAIVLFSGDCLAQKKHKAIFVIADGIPADLIESLPMPNLRKISRQGGYARAHVGGDKGTYNQTPTISAVGYNSLLTGTWVNKHNVWDNDIVMPNYNYWNIFRFLKSEFPQKKTAIFSTWLDNRTKLIGSEAKEAGNLQPDIIYDGMELDTLKFPHDTTGYFYHLIDEDVVKHASESIKKDAPDLSWVYLEYTDEMGHRHGNSSYLTNAVLLLDKQFGKLWDAIGYREKNFNETWQIYITTDHGRELNGYGHGGQSDRERTTWIATNAQGLNKHFKKGDPGIVDIMPSISQFMGIKIPRKQQFEIDGIPLTGKLSSSLLAATKTGDAIRINWNVLDTTGRVKIWLSTKDNFKTGGSDEFKLVDQLPVVKGSAAIDIKKYPSSYYKIVLEFPFNTLNKMLTITE